MLQTDRWLLPEGIEEVLPREAVRLESMRRRLLDLYRNWGYDLVIPPMIEYLESLLTGTGNDLELQTFKLTDQLTGRMMGLRADMTPQVARIETHHLRREVPSRLCYLGTVLHTRPEGLGGSRSPMQVGAELYGHSGVESDLEVLGLMVETLRNVGLEGFHLDLGHVGIYRELAAAAGLGEEREALLFDAMQRKARPEIDQFVAEWQLSEPFATALRRLPDLNGDAAVLERAAELLGDVEPAARAVEELRSLARAAAEQIPEVPLHFDLAELRGYHYHTGAVFAAFMPRHGRAVAVGGRYDDIGKVFGHARPATGFSADLKTLLGFVEDNSEPSRGIFAPAAGGAPLRKRVAELRQQGERVVQELPGQRGSIREMGCDRELVEVNGSWEVRLASD